MTISFSKRLAKLEEAVASRTQGPKTIRRVVVEVGADLLSRFSVTRDFTDRSAIRISEKFKGTAPEAWEAIAGAVLKRKGF